MSVDAAYAEVQRITRRRARNFAYGIMLLPREKRRAIAAIYAFARRVDDVADGDLPVAAKRRELERLRAAALQEPPSNSLLLGEGEGDAMLVALADARSRFPIPG
jgi:phytoene synthase